jgi:hypothetical protein
MQVSIVPLISFPSACIYFLSHMLDVEFLQVFNDHHRGHIYQMYEDGERKGRGVSDDEDEKILQNNGVARRVRRHVKSISGYFKYAQEMEMRMRVLGHP